MTDSNAPHETVEHFGSVDHRVGRLEGRVDRIEPLVDDHETVLYRGVEGSPSIVSHISATNAKLDYNNERLKDLVWLGKAIFALILAIGPLLVTIEGCAPVWRQKMGVPSSSSVPIAPKPVDNQPATGIPLQQVKPQPVVSAPHRAKKARKSEDAGSTVPVHY